MSGSLQLVRNIGIAAHIDAGKTTTTERVLFYAGRTHKIGEVDDGTTTTDFDAEEQQRGITIYSAAVSFPWRGHVINLIDTPGHVDFTAEVERSLRVLDGMVAVFDAREGVEAQSETVWRQADKYRVPRVCFINKMDRVGADFERALQSIRDRLGVKAVAIQMPIGSGGDFKGLIDLIEQRAVYYHSEERGAGFDEEEIPESLRSAAAAARREMIEAAAEWSEELLIKYLHDEEAPPAMIRAALRRGALARDLFPVLCGSALKFVGVQRLLDAACDYLPSPLDIPPAVGHDPDKPDKEIPLPCRDDVPVAALVFKIIAEKPVDLHFLRVYSGKIKPNSRLLNAATGEKENVTRLYRMFAKRRDQVDEAGAGDIVAVVGPKNTLTGHTLCDPHRRVALESIQFPETVISVSIEPRSSKDRDKLMESLAALTRQDPTLSVRHVADTGQTLLAGMGELHLEVMANRLRNDMNVDVIVGKPRVSYRETVTARGEGEGRFVRQIGGRSHHAVLRVRIEPRARAEAGRQSFDVRSALTPEVLLPEYAKAAETGVRDAASSGILGGYPVIDWSVTFIGADTHETDSSELAFENAGRLAFYDAMKAANAALLEPIMSVEVVVPDDYFGGVMGDLNSRGAVIRETHVRGLDHVIDADVPLSQMFGYVTRLRSLTQGRATASMSPSHYAAVSKEQMKILIG